MNPLIIVNIYNQSEITQVNELYEKFKPQLLVVTNIDVPFPFKWKVNNMNKSTVEWTRRLFIRFLQEPSYDCMIKIDPDTHFKQSYILPSVTCDVAGDFRKTNLGWVWFGAYQYLTRNATEKIIQDKEYVGKCIYQDIMLAKSISRLGLIAYNMPEVNGWCNTNDAALITHKGRKNISRVTSGILNLSLRDKE